MFSAFFINRPRFAIVLSIVLIILGLLSLAVLPVAQYPEITPPQIVVSTTYSGAGAKVLVDRTTEVFDRWEPPHGGTRPR